MHEDAVTEVELVAGVKDGGTVFARVAGEVFTAEGIGAHKTVVSDVPVAGEVEIGWVIEGGDAGDLTVDGAGVIAPWGTPAPGFGFTDAPPSVFDAAVRFGVHASGDTNGDETRFFGIAEIDVAEARNKNITPLNDVFEDRRTDLYSL